MNNSSHSVYNLKYHLVLVTKYRRKCFTNFMLDELQLILEVHCEKWGVKLLEFGGESDHVHLLIEFSPIIQPSKFINNLKTVSSRLLRKIFAAHLATYYWKPVL